MRMIDLIAKKRDGAAHDAAELGFIARAAAEGSVPDYQLSAWLMAAFQRGMTEAETVAWTRAMAASGKRLRLSSLRRPAVDKHSTGGVGDGISLALAPLVAAAGVAVPMMSGRSLGHTGGTLDKLESIRGFKVRLPPAAVERQVRRIGLCMFGQSEELAPADGRLYALRDSTATVESLPLIVASILSKKLAEDLDALVLDVKCGSGAFLAGMREARALGRALVCTGRRLGIRVMALVSSMDQPLGAAVGDSLEMRQAIELLRGESVASDYRELLLALGGWMLRMAGKARHWQEGARRLETLIRDGLALEKFRELVRAQGGDERVALDPGRFLPKARRWLPVRASRSGFLSRLDARQVGRAAAALGAGRSRMEDGIDHGAGLRLFKKLGDRVVPGAEIARLYAGSRRRLEEGERAFRSAWAVSSRRPSVPALIREVIR